MYPSVREMKEAWRRCLGRCGYPDCAEPCLPHIDGVALTEGRWVRNVLEIFVRRGERRPATADDLILLCSPHLRLLDYVPEMFSIAMLKMWKHHHEQRIATMAEPPCQTRSCLVGRLRNLTSHVEDVRDLPRLSGSPPTVELQRRIRELRVLEGAAPSLRAMGQIIRDGRHLLPIGASAVAESAEATAARLDRAAIDGSLDREVDWLPIGLNELLRETANGHVGI